MYKKTTIDLISTKSQFTNRQIIDKAVNMLDLLKKISEDPVLGKELYLIGGTAINLTEVGIPRLSVDIDMDYMNKEGSVFDIGVLRTHRRILKAIAKSLNMSFAPEEEESDIKLTIYMKYGTKFTSTRRSILNLDVGYLYKCPIFPTVRKKIRALYPNADAGNYWVRAADINELWAGKAVAVIYKTQADPAPEEAADLYAIQMTVARHMYDIARLEYALKENNSRLARLIDIEKLKVAFILKGVTRICDLHVRTGENIRLCTVEDLETELLPYLRQQKEMVEMNEEEKQVYLKKWLDKMKILVQDFLFRITRKNWSKKQEKFVTEFHDGKYKPELLFGRKLKSFKHLLNNKYLIESAASFKKKRV